MSGPLRRIPLFGLPGAPSLGDVDAAVPPIASCAATGPRPFWSVMIPSYNAGPFLARTLASVLAQDPGPARMQIEVVDGGSTTDRPEDLVREQGKGRVEFSRIAENRGAATTFNACIERARGEWVHILHADDIVLDGFYALYEDTINAWPEATTVVGQSVSIDEHDVPAGVEGPAPPTGGGILADFVSQVATHWLVTCPAVVVKRTAYEAVGGYSTYFSGPLDWDMWMRLGLHGPVASVPRPASAYRRHTGSLQWRICATGQNVLETCQVIASNLARLERAGLRRPTDARSWRAREAAWADKQVWDQDGRGSLEGRLIQARWAWALAPSAPRLLMVLKSWARYRCAQLRALAGGRSAGR